MVTYQTILIIRGKELAQMLFSVFSSGHTSGTSESSTML